MKDPIHQILFGTPLFQFPAELPQEVNEKLRKTILEMEKTIESIPAKSNAGSWHSEPLENKKELCFQILNHYMDTGFLKILKTTTNDEYKVKWTKSSWAIVTRQYNYNVLHSHSNSDLSCVYYVDTGNYSKKSKDRAEELSGKMVLTDPRGSLLECSKNVHGQDELYKAIFGNNFMALTPTAGLLVFFPSWLLHSVMTYQGTKPRIVISANYTFKN